VTAADDPMDMPVSVAPRQRLARVVTDVFAPLPTGGVLLIVIAAHSPPTAAEPVRAGLMAAFFDSVVPVLYIIRGVRRKRLSDHHVGIRQQRPVVLLVAIVSVLAGLGVLRAMSAPRELMALVGAMVAGLVASLLVTLFWKISVHAAVTAGAVVIVVLVFGPLLLILAALVVLVCWSRLELGDHTAPQVVVGSAVGGVIAAVVFTLLRYI